MRWPVRTVAERFWPKVNKDGPLIIDTKCWTWTGATAKGYGKFKHPAHKWMAQAHRIAWELTFGTPPPPDLLLCHRCDNRACVNPAHLFPGTVKDNSMDMASKGRNPHWTAMLAAGRPGRANPMARLSEEDVCAIRATSNTSQAALAAKYGISKSQISRIIRRQKWKHV